MRKELTIHLSAFLVSFLVMAVLRQYLQFSYLPFFVGALVGTFLPDIDHFIYIYYLRPHELTSQRAKSMIQKRDFVGSWNLLSSTRYERTNLVFHNAWFQVLFLILTFWVLSSSLNLFGRGLVLAFSLHLLVDQFIDLRDTKSLSNWFAQLSITLSRTQVTIYLLVVSSFLLFLAFFL